MDRINGEIRRELSEILREEVKDPRVDIRLVSVLKAETTRDLKYCKVYISVLGDEAMKEEVRTALKSAAGFIRRELASRLNLRNTPELKFVMDDSIEYGIHIDQMLRKIAAELPPEDEEPDGTAASPEAEDAE
ncbi:MAG: 30S ribosome-binding factor RbfA [Firmicutes bacterium]|nr:30S ribosome-binding factor RbfA [Bacillota bacterium]